MSILGKHEPRKSLTAPASPLEFKLKSIMMREHPRLHQRFPGEPASSKPPSSRQEPKHFMVLYTRQRSGSSFVGGLFSHNPHVYYTFEPMNFVRSSKVPGDITNPAVVSKRLEEISHCNFRETLTRTRKKPYWRVISFCAKYPSSSILHTICARTSVSGWENACKMFNYSLTKDIVIPSLRVMQPLIDKGVKVLHLVRDPRAVVNSRMRIENPPKMTAAQKKKRYTLELQKITKHCEEAQNDLDLILENKANRTHPLMSYYLLRYEDIALEPEKYARKIYNFSGFPYHVNVDTWLNESTKLPDHSPDAKRPFGIKRNSTKPVSAWAKSLPPDIIYLIEDVCKDMMTSLGYKNIPREQQPLNKITTNQVVGRVHQKYSMLMKNEYELIEPKLSKT